jgi:hypothetical protein
MPDDRVVSEEVQPRCERATSISVALLAGTEEPTEIRGMSTPSAMATAM